MNQRISVSLGARSYNIHVGGDVLSRAGEIIAPFARGHVPVVTDAHVAALYLDTMLAALKAANIDAEPVVLPPGEETKSFAGLERLTSALLKLELERSGLIVALGGGVIGDLAGFAAGILKRGVDFAQVPTTLLAQVDSSVGGKTAINTREGKNLLGLFHQPRVVLADIGTLATLPRRELLAGYAEVVKYGALADAAFFEWLEHHGRDALAGDSAALSHMVAHSCRMKADVVARDERENGDRALLNLGHTFGHALEAATGYSQRLLHGEGVAIGIVLAFKLSARMGLSDNLATQRIERHFRNVGLPAAIGDIPGPRPGADEILAHMLHDKKAKNRKVNFILVRGIGHAFVSADVELSTVREVLSD
jgi:3-dehydroquinate synthase